MNGKRASANNTPRRVLMIAYSYPPAGTSGSMRTVRLARYLPESGWAPTVLTVAKDKTLWGAGDASEGVIPGVKVLRAPFFDVMTAVENLMRRHGALADAVPGVESALRFSGSRGSLRGIVARIFRWAKRWASFPDRRLLWLPSAVATGRKELRSNHYEAIYSAFPSGTDLLVAYVLHRISGLPWVADLRDPWSQNRYTEFTPIELRLTRLLERCVLKRAAAITTVSEPIAGMLEDLHGDKPAGIHTITNGFDPDDYRDDCHVTQGRFVITYTGMLYGTKRDPSPILRAIEELIDDGEAKPDEIAMAVYGPDTEFLEQTRASLKYPGTLEVKGVVSRSESVQRQRESTVLLTIQWGNPYSAIGYGGKVFEYLGAKRPILAWNPSGGVLDELLETTGAGISVGSPDHLKEVFRKWLDEYHHTGTVAYHGRDDQVRTYGWDMLSGRMASVFDTAAQASNPLP